MNNKLLPLVAGVLAIAMGGMALLGAGVAVVPLIPSDLDAKYKLYAAARRPAVDHLAMEAIDTVRYHQDWSLATDENIQQLADMFPYCWQEDNGKDKVDRCRLRSLDEVAGMLGFTADETELAHVYLSELNALSQDSGGN